MMSHEQIMSLSRRMARQNRHREPVVMDDWDLSGDAPLRAAIRKMPFLGVTRRAGYKVVDPVKDGAIDRRGWCKEPFLMVDKGGPIIEREAILLHHFKGEWTGMIENKDDGQMVASRAHKPLVAAMRCYVASKLGNEVEIPEELL